MNACRPDGLQLLLQLPPPPPRSCGAAVAPSVPIPSGERCTDDAPHLSASSVMLRCTALADLSCEPTLLQRAEPSPAVATILQHVSIVTAFGGSAARVASPLLTPRLLPAQAPPWIATRRTGTRSAAGRPAVPWTASSPWRPCSGTMTRRARTAAWRPAASGPRSACSGAWSAGACFRPVWRDAADTGAFVRAAWAPLSRSHSIAWSHTVPAASNRKPGFAAKRLSMTASHRSPYRLVLPQHATN